MIYNKYGPGILCTYWDSGIGESGCSYFWIEKGRNEDYSFYNNTELSPKNLIAVGYGKPIGPTELCRWYDESV